MNRVILMGRLTKDPDIRGEGTALVAKYTLAVDRKYKRDEDDSVDFISCVTFSKGAEFAEKYLKKGTKMLVSGRIQTGSYTNKDGQKIYTTDVIVEEQEFAESKKASEESNGGSKSKAADPDEDFMNINDAVDDMPF